MGNSAFRPKEAPMISFCFTGNLPRIVALARPRVLGIPAKVFNSSLPIVVRKMSEKISTSRANTTVVAYQIWTPWFSLVSIFRR